jgi:site-specific DNA-methyltransferase (adenine-specific)
MPKLSVDTVIHGDCIEVMKSMEDNSIDALVSDSPYGLGFMGKEWDKFTSMKFLRFTYKWSIEALRILKPGAYLLNFSAPKKYHLMACGVELAGFNIKDMIMWCYGSGFPKSLDISKAIDQYYGKEREVIREKTYEIYNGNNAYQQGINTSKPRSESCEITKPTTPEAQKWDGWGTGLKPSFEPVVVAQKPYIGTYAENVLKYGVGGINIDKCRINYTQDKEVDSRIYNQDKNITRGSHGIDSFVKIAPDGNEFPMYKQEKGRFPANLILTHHPECKLIGTKEVGSGKFKKTNFRKGGKCEYSIGLNGKKNAPDNYGVQEIDSYACHPECPIRLLDEQSGETKSSKGGFTTNHQKDNRTHQWSKNGDWNTQKYIDNANWHNDKGGASRFFYCSKAHKSERNAGLMDLEHIDNTEMVNRKEGSAGIENPRAGAGRGQGAKNNIATLKPINVMRYLVRLVTPSNGIVLDPFAGSGTTGISCLIEGFHYILIEKRKRFAKTIIPKRLEYWKDPSNWSVLKDHNVLPKIKRIKDKKQNISIEAYF